MKFKKILLLILFSVVLLLTGCGNNTVKVTFDSDNGSPVETVTINKGETVAKPTTPTNGDLEFQGWYLNENLFNFKSKIKVNITLVAKWAPKEVIKYTVVFRDYKDGIINVQQVEEGKAAIAPEAPERENYIFTGWDVDFSHITEDIDVRPTYKFNTDRVFIYKVIFEDHFGAELKVEEVEEGKSATAPLAPERPGYIFTGWSKDFTNVHGNIRTRAQYMSEDKELNIKYNLNDGVWGYTSKTEYVVSFLKDFYDFVKPTESLNEFIYANNDPKSLKGTWKNYIGGSVSEVNKLLYNNDLTLDNEEFFFNCKKYKEKWANLGLWVASQNNRFNGKNYEYGALDFYRYIINDPAGYIEIYGDKFYSYPTLNEPEKLTFMYSNETVKLHTPLSSSFQGWYLNSDFSGEPVTEIPAKTVRDFEIYAKWDQTITYEIYFNTDTDKNIDPITAQYGDNITLPTNLTKFEHEFIGWYIGDELISSPFEFKYNCSIILKAHWRSTKIVLEPLKYNGVSVKYRNSSTEVMIPSTYSSKGDELRAAWVSSFISDFKASPNEATMKANLTEVLDLLESFNMNCMIFHIRTMNNAFYKTKMAPIQSDYGDYQTFEKWDYLTWLIDETHKRGMEFHAWMNPYRIKSSGYPADVTPEMVAQEYKDYPLNAAHDPENILITSSRGAILNPAKKAVQQNIIDVCLEVMENYDVDAIHFDDYFYAKMTPENNILKQADQKDYLEFIKTHSNFKPTSTKDKSVWRRRNVDNFIEGLSNAMREFNRANHRKVQLGISPTGIYKNGNGSVDTGSNTAGQEHYADYLYCDSLKWVKNEWIDYIMPQSYWGFTHRVAGYADVMDWWNKAVEGTRVNLYSGIGVYMSERGGTYSWCEEPFEVSNQILYTTKLKNVKGVSFFAYNHLKRLGSNPNALAYKGLMRIKNEYWTTKVKTPDTIASNNLI